MSPTTPVKKPKDQTKVASTQAENVKDQSQSQLKSAKDQSLSHTETPKSRAIDDDLHNSQPDADDLEELDAIPEPDDDDDGDDNEKETTTGTKEQETAQPEGQQKKKGGFLSGAGSLIGKGAKAAASSKAVQDKAWETGKGYLSKKPEQVSESLDDTADTAKDTTDTVKDTAKDTTDTVKDTAEDTTDAAEDTTKDTTKDTTEKAKDATEDLEDTATSNLPDLSVLKGLEVSSTGAILNSAGKKVGRLVEGDAEDLEGYPIGENGEILDDDGDLVGRCEILPDVNTDDLPDVETVKNALPGLDILNGLTVDNTGNVLNEDGDMVGQLTDGEISKVKGKEINEKGEIVDDNGKVLGTVKVLDEAAELPRYQTNDQDEKEEDEDNQVENEDDQGKQEEEEEAPEQAEGNEEELNSGLKDAQEELAAKPSQIPEAPQVPVEDELPSIDALQGQTVNPEGKVTDPEGNVIGELVEGTPSVAAGLDVDAEGQVVDQEGNVVGKVDLTPEGAEKLVQEPELLKKAKSNLKILDGKKVNKKGKILDEEGEIIGELVDGEADDCRGLRANEKGELCNKDGEVVGRVKVVEGEAADEAMKELGLLDDADADADADQNEEKPAEDVQERVDSAQDGVMGEDEQSDPEEPTEEVKEQQENTPDEEAEKLQALEGHKVNKKGQLLDQDGEPIGELSDGDLEKCLGLKANDKGEVLDKDGNVVGHVSPFTPTPPEEEDAAAEGDEQPLAEEAEKLQALEGLKVNKKGQLVDQDGEPIGELSDGELEKCLGLKANDKGEVLDKDGNVVGHVSPLTPPSEEEEEQTKPEEEEQQADDDADELPPLSILEGFKVNKSGKIINDKDIIIGELVTGDPKKISKLGITCDAEGQFWDSKGHVIGTAKTLPSTEDVEGDAPFAGLDGLIVRRDSLVEDENGNVVGKLVEGDGKKLIGRAVDEDGDVLDKRGSVVGHAERYEEEEPAPEAEPEEEAKPDLSVLVGKVLNKHGNVVDNEGSPIGRLVEGNVKDLVGRKVGEEGIVYNDTGKAAGRCELIPDGERSIKKEGPFAGYDEPLKVIKDGKVADANGNVIGIIVDGDAKKLVGQTVDEDGDIIDQHGNVKGHADPHSEEEAEETPVDLSALAGCTVNKAGNVVDASGNVVGRVSSGEPKNMIGKKVDGKGQIWDNSGQVIGQAELVQGHDNKADGPFSGFDNNTVHKDGMVKTADGTIIGRVTEGDVKKLVGHSVDEDGDISDKNGNTIGKAERWEPEEKERRVNPMSGRRVNKEGEVRDENGDVMGRLTAGDLGHCVGLEIDDSGYVVDNDGNKVGEVTLLENIAEPEEEEPQEETEEEKQKREDSELADKMSSICSETLDRVQPIMKQITEYINKADATPREDLNEEELVNNVKPLIEEGGRILQECNGALRGLDPDGHIASQAKARAKTREATPSEYRLADLLKELTNSVVTTIDNAKKKISDMPHAKKKLNPLWGLLTEPLFQILAAVGLLLAGVLGLVGRLLSALGLGGLVNALLGGLGIDKLLSGLGLGGISEALGGGKKEKKKGGGIGSLPIVGGLVGGKD